MRRNFNLSSCSWSLLLPCWYISPDRLTTAQPQLVLCLVSCAECSSRVKVCGVHWSVQYSTVQYSTVLYCTVLYSTVLYSTVLVSISAMQTASHIFGRTARTKFKVKSAAKHAFVGTSGNACYSATIFLSRRYHTLLRLSSHFLEVVINVSSSAGCNNNTGLKCQCTGII